MVRSGTAEPVPAGVTGGGLRRVKLFVTIAADDDDDDDELTWLLFLLRLQGLCGRKVK